MYKTFAQQLVDTITEAGYEPRSYSGRGMCGKECVGLVTDDPAFTVAVKLVVATDSDEQGEFIDELANTRVCEDSMGMSTIVYFPDAGWPEEDEQC